MSRSSDITQLLQEAGTGSREAFDALLPVVYDELREIAHYRLQKYRPGQTLNTTALVHEAYIRLIDQTQAKWESRAHFSALASRVMRYILIDYARERSAAKRGGDQVRVDLETVTPASSGREETLRTDLLTIDQALNRLTAFSERLGQVVEYRFFGGLTYEEIAIVTGRSVPTVKRDWKRARAWLYDMMETPDS